MLCVFVGGVLCRCRQGLFVWAVSIVGVVIDPVVRR